MCRVLAICLPVKTTLGKKQVLCDRIEDDDDDDEQKAKCDDFLKETLARDNREDDDNDDDDDGTNPCIKKVKMVMSEREIARIKKIKQKN